MESEGGSGSDFDEVEYGLEMAEEFFDSSSNKEDVAVVKKEPECEDVRVGESALLTFDYIFVVRPFLSLFRTRRSVLTNGRSKKNRTITVRCRRRRPHLRHPGRSSVSPIRARRVSARRRAGNYTSIVKFLLEVRKRRACALTTTPITRSYRTTNTCRIYGLS